MTLCELQDNCEVSAWFLHFYSVVISQVSPIGQEGHYQGPHQALTADNIRKHFPNFLPQTNLDLSPDKLSSEI